MLEIYYISKVKIGFVRVLPSWNSHHDVVLLFSTIYSSLRNCNKFTYVCVYLFSHLEGHRYYVTNHSLQ